VRQRRREHRRHDARDRRDVGVRLLEDDDVVAVEGKVVELKEVESIANLPSREELISKVLFLINAQAQRLVTVIQAVPRNLAVVMEQVRAQKEAQGA